MPPLVQRIPESKVVLELPDPFGGRLHETVVLMEKEAQGGIWPAADGYCLELSEEAADAVLSGIPV